MKHAITMNDGKEKKKQKLARDWLNGKISEKKLSQILNDKEIKDLLFGKHLIENMVKVLNKNHLKS